MLETVDFNDRNRPKTCREVDFPTPYRSRTDAPAIDGQVFVDGATHLKVGDLVEVEDVDERDRWGRLVE